MAGELIKLYFLTWHDYEDGVSHGKVIRVPEGEDPETVAYQYLNRVVGVGNHLLESINEAQAGDEKREF